MCGTYTLFTDREIAEIREIVREAEDNSKRHVQTGTIYPKDIAPVLLQQDERLFPYAMYWGFPFSDQKKVAFNARSETIREKTMFRGAFAERRCLVPSTGFYEWQKAVESLALQSSLIPDMTEKPKGKAIKIPYLFNLQDSPLVYMAGIYNHYHGGPEEQRHCFTILTTEANAWMKDVHPRMPVVLQPEEYGLWLRGGPEAAMLFDRSNIALAKQETRPLT